MALSLGRGLIAIATAAVVVAVIVALLVIDGPATERTQRIDARRIDDLRALSEALDCAWSRDPALGLSGSLEDIVAGVDEEIGAGRLPWSCRPGALVDPETGAAYVYRRLASDRYELCATFGRPSPEAEPSSPDPWAHGAGEVCFPRAAQLVDLR